MVEHNFWDVNAVASATVGRGLTATAAKQRAEVPPKLPCRDEASPKALHDTLREADSSSQGLPKKYRLATRDDFGFHSLRPRHVEQREWAAAMGFRLDTRNLRTRRRTEKHRQALSDL